MDLLKTMEELIEKAKKAEIDANIILENNKQILANCKEIEDAVQAKLDKRMKTLAILEKMEKGH